MSPTPPRRDESLDVQVARLEERVEDHDRQLTRADADVRAFAPAVQELGEMRAEIRALREGLKDIKDAMTSKSRESRATWAALVIALVGLVGNLLVQLLGSHP